VGAEPLMGLIEEGQGALSGLVEGAMEDGALRSLLIDGLINGVGSALVFLPQIIILILLIALLEASGYMARAAFLLDRVLSKVGLSGRSFVPMASAMACAVPGVLATRVIADERERLATIAVLPLMSCSARLPVYVVLIGAFFPSSSASLVLLALYLLGIVIAALVAWSLRKTILKGRASLFLMELPVYQRPSARVVWGQVKAAAREFLVLAGTIIVATSVVIWALSYYPRPVVVAEAFDSLRAPLEVTTSHIDGPHKAVVEAMVAQLDNAERGAYLEQSALADIGRAMQPVFALAGFDWRTTVGVIAAFPARELIIPTLGVLYSLGDVDAGTYDLAFLDEGDKHRDGLSARLMATTRDDGTPAWSPLIALSVMVFFALCSQCMGTLGAIYRETRSWKWPVFVFGYMTALAWLMAVLVYQVGSALGLGGRL
jgi:ferrous iron transport protein B